MLAHITKKLEYLPNLTHGYYFQKHGTFDLPQIIQQSRLTISFCKEHDDTSSAIATNEYLPILVNQKDPNFDFDTFIEKLKTESLGRCLIHVPVMNSTFDVLEGQFLKHGLFVVADQMLNGQGRGSNKWISPKGCAMTSIQIETKLDSKLAQNPGLLLILPSLAVVHSLRKDSSENLNIKWPNDMYLGFDAKLGGVKIISNQLTDKMVFNIGIGFNLDNEWPTTSWNAHLSQKLLPKLKREEFFAKVFNCLEMLFDELENQADSKLDIILEMYQKYWLHQDQPVQVTNLEGEVFKGIVKRLDKNGFLIVEMLDNSKIVPLDPEAYSFDVKQGIITPRA